MTDWNQVKINAVIAAAQGIMASGKLGQFLDIDEEFVAEHSVKIANALVNELKKEIEN